MKSNKLLIVLSLALGTLTLNSCSKSTTTTTTNINISADINGTATTFNTNAVAISGTVSGQTFTNITGQAKDGTMLSITLMGAPVAGKTYSDAATNDNDKPLIDITPPGNDSSDFLNDDSSPNVPSVTISSVSSGTISGTFKGGLVQGIETSNGTLPTKSITNGKFSLTYTSK